MIGTPPGNNLLLGALESFIEELGPHADQVTITGGVARSVLLSELRSFPTSDIDVLLDVGWAYDDLDMSWLEDTLLGLGYTTTGPGWRWTRLDLRGQIHIDLICDRPGQSGQQVVALGDCAHASAANLPGARAGLVSRQYREYSSSRAAAWFPDIEPFMLMKASAATTRRSPQDYVDFCAAVNESLTLHPISSVCGRIFSLFGRTLEEYSWEIRHTVDAVSTDRSQVRRALSNAFGSGPQLARTLANSRSLVDGLNLANLQADH